MAESWQQVISGLATGGIYTSLVLAIVLIYRSTLVINFAEGEMATFSTRGSRPACARQLPGVPVRIRRDLLRRSARC
jgi:hypothetical protein